MAARILVWDLCNEPQAHDLNADVNKRQFAWLSEVAGRTQKGKFAGVAAGVMKAAREIETMPRV